MTKKTLLLSTAALLLTAASASAQTLITGFTFETSAPVTAGPFAAETGTEANTSGTSAASAVHAGASTYSSPAGNGSAHSFSSTNFAMGDYYQFTLSTTGLTGLYSTFGMSRSGTGPATFSLEYSIDGTNFTTVTDVADSTGTVPAGTAFAVNSSPSFSATPANYRAADEYTADLTGITALNNQATVTFRLFATVAGASAGTARVDDFNISTGGFVFPASAAAVPEPSTFAAMALGGLGAMTMLRARRRTA